MKVIYSGPEAAKFIDRYVASKIRSEYIPRSEVESAWAEISKVWDGRPCHNKCADCINAKNALDRLLKGDTTV